MVCHPASRMSEVVCPSRWGLGRSSGAAISVSGHVDPGRDHDVDGWVSRRVGRGWKLDESRGSDADQPDRGI